MSNALFGLLGVIVGAFIPWVKEALVRKRTRMEHATYLAVRVICILDEYVDRCVAIVGDDGSVMGQASHRDENGQEYFHPVERLPDAPDFPADLDWRSIDSDLMYRILTFPNSVRIENSYIQWVGDEEAWPPYYEEVFEARHKGYAKLGLEAIEIVEELRRRFKLPEASRPDWNPDWNAKKHFNDKLDQIEKNKKVAAGDAPAKKEKQRAS